MESNPLRIPGVRPLSGCNSNTSLLPNGGKDVPETNQLACRGSCGSDHSARGRGTAGECSWRRWRPWWSRWSRRWPRWWWQKRGNTWRGLFSRFRQLPQLRHLVLPGAGIGHNNKPTGLGGLSRGLAARQATTVCRRPSAALAPSVPARELIEVDPFVVAPTAGLPPRGI
jgi:hypothetical protein